MVALAGFLFYRQIMRANQITVQRVNAPLISANVTFIPDSNSEQTLGNPGAPITITEFMDLGCAKCLALHATIKAFVSKNPLKIRLIWKDAVLPKIFSNQQSLPAHRAAFCAGNPDFASPSHKASDEQSKASTGTENKFWEFVDLIAASKSNLAENNLKKIAENLQLDASKWWQCANSPEAEEAIKSSTQMADQLGIKSLPAIFVNNKLINTGKDINIEKMLEEFIRE